MLLSPLFLPIVSSYFIPLYVAFFNWLALFLFSYIYLFWWQALLGFVNFKLYHSINVKYPPILDPRLEALAAGLPYCLTFGMK